MGIPKSKLGNLLRHVAPPQSGPLPPAGRTDSTPTPGGAFTLVIPLETPSLNVWQRWHWGKQRDVKEAWALYIRMGAMKAGYPHGRFMPRQRMRITVVSYRARLLDEIDNLRGGFKPVLDALRDEGIIYDDGPEWLEAGDIRQVVDRKNRRTEITVEQV